MKKRVLISGGGIAGMAAAWWLERAGAQVTIIERARGFQALGHYISLKSHGVSTVRAMGLLDACRQREMALSELKAYRPSGSLLRDLDTTLLERSVSGMVLFRRADLHAALYEAVREHTDVRFGSEVRAIREIGDQVEVDLDAGTERVDLFVGADGVHSHARKLLFGDGGVTPMGGRYIAITVDYAHGFTPGALGVYMGQGKFVALLPRTATNVSALIYQSDHGVQAPSSDASSLREFLLSTHADFAPEVRRTFEAIDAQAFVFMDQVTMITLPTITRGRSALLGDAAHCPTFMSGMGASLALQGAHALGTAMYEHGSDTAAAVTHYERAIRDVARGYQRSAYTSRRFLLGRNPLLIAARDAAVQWTPDWMFGLSARRFYQAARVGA